MRGLHGSYRYVLLFILSRSVIIAFFLMKKGSSGSISLVCGYATASALGLTGLKPVTTGLDTMYMLCKKCI